MAMKCRVEVEVEQEEGKKKVRLVDRRLGSCQICVGLCSFLKI